MSNIRSALNVCVSLVSFDSSYYELLLLRKKFPDMNEQTKKNLCDDDVFQQDLKSNYPKLFEKLAVILIIPGPEQYYLEMI
jgi:hypothetical protein